MATYSPSSAHNPLSTTNEENIDDTVRGNVGNGTSTRNQSIPVEQDANHEAMTKVFEWQEHSGHLYISVTAQDDSLQINGDITVDPHRGERKGWNRNMPGEFEILEVDIDLPVQEQVLQKRNVYQDCQARDKGRQINGNVIATAIPYIFK